MKNQILLSRESKRNASKRYILTLIHGESAISQTRIVERTSIRPGTVQALIEELMQEGLIRMSGEGKSKGGRKPTLLEINPDAYWTIGIDVDEERISAGIVNLKGVIVKSVGRTRCRFKNQNDFIDAVKQVIRELVSEIPSTTPLLGAGIGIPGFVDRERGIARHCSYYDWMRDVPVKALLEKDFGVPFAIDNDTVVATLGEKWFGAGKGIDNFLYVDLGETVGMGIVVEGRLYTGFSGNAGELGHTVIQSNGPLCICGNEGCVEALASGMALRREAEDLVRKGVISLISDSVQDTGEIPLETIITAAERGDKVAYKMITEMASYLGLAISNVVNVLNPEKVILGGSLMGAREIVAEAIRKAIKSHCLSPIAAVVSVGVSQLGEKSGILGASTLVSQRFFDFS
jgi:glucokinase-like ROK family protein